MLQDFEDTRKLGDTLLAMGRDFSWHKIVPFVGALTPEPVIKDKRSVVLFGAYSMWKYAESHALEPGVFRIEPFLRQDAWQPYLLNGPDALVIRFDQCGVHLNGTDADVFLRPVEDSKEIPGRVMAASEIVALSKRVSALPEDELPIGSLRGDTEVMLCAPQRILEEWRLWVVDDQVVTYSRYKQAGRVDYVPHIPPEVLAFGETMAQANAGYAPAYVMDICRIADGLRIIETNGINGAGFYAADLKAIVLAIERLCER
ncbi:ATP-grasp domain-containing protein [Shimia sp.]|uniref:ATP-grasp domain-containing protein n=1 Tax=Shimia sp. TaxID=1954381 RepID=UPI003BA9291B